MHDLVIGPSARVFQEPHLRIEYNELGTFTLIYVNGAKKPWERSAAPDHLAELVTRFLTKRTRWFRVRQDGA